MSRKVASSLGSGYAESSERSLPVPPGRRPQASPLAIGEVEIALWRTGRIEIGFLGLAVVLSALTVTRPASGSQTYPGPLSIAELTRRADVIVVGDVVSARGAWDATRTSISTRIEMAVAETLKGAAAPVIAFSQLGGRVGDLVTTVAGASTFDAGERVLVFLERRPDGSLRLADPFHGTFRIERDASGRDDAVRSTGTPRVDRIPLDQVRRAVGGTS